MENKCQRALLYLYNNIILYTSHRKFGVCSSLYYSNDVLMCFSRRLVKRCEHDRRNDGRVTWRLSATGGAADAGRHRDRKAPRVVFAVHQVSKTRILTRGAQNCRRWPANVGLQPVLRIDEILVISLDYTNVRVAVILTVRKRTVEFLYRITGLDRTQLQLKIAKQNVRVSIYNMYM